MIGPSTSAMMKRHTKRFGRPSVSMSNLSPYVFILEPLAANKNRTLDLFDSSAKHLGITEISAPVSMRKVKFVSGSIMFRRFLIFCVEEEMPLFFAWLRRLYGCADVTGVFI